MSDALIAAHRDDRRACALSASAGAIGLGPDSGGDEPAARRRRLSRRRRARAPRARPDIALSSDFIVGFPGETDADFEATLALVARDRLRLRLRLQIFAASGHAGGRARRPDRRCGQRRRAWRRLQLCSRSSARRSTARRSGDAVASCSRSPAVIPGQVDRPVALYAIGVASRAPPPDRARSPTSRSSASAPMRCAAACRAAVGTSGQSRDADGDLIAHG